MILKNKDLKNKVSTILNHYTVKNYEKLIQDANSLLKKNPNIDILWNILGLTYQLLI